MKPEISTYECSSLGEALIIIMFEICSTLEEGMTIMLVILFHHNES